MKPITIVCKETLPLPPAEIARQILDVTNWSDFQGYGAIPGIRRAQFEVLTPSIVGSRIQVTNLDGSTHVEEITEWQPDHRLQLHLLEFSAPLSRLANRFVETWEFQILGNETEVTRTFELHAKRLMARPVLWMISFLLQLAVARHLRQMKQQ